MASLFAAKSANRAFRAVRPQANRPITVQRNLLRSIATLAVVDKAAVLTDVRTIIAEQLSVEVEKIGPDAKFVDLGADSLDTVEIMMALEEKFQLQLDEEGAEKITTVQEAADLIASQVGSK